MDQKANAGSNRIPGPALLCNESAGSRRRHFFRKWRDIFPKAMQKLGLATAEEQQNPFNGCHSSPEDKLLSAHSYADSAIERGLDDLLRCKEKYEDQDEMEKCSEAKLVVKNSFLQLVPELSMSVEHRRRAYTDSDLTYSSDGFLHCKSMDEHGCEKDMECCEDESDSTLESSGASSTSLCSSSDEEAEGDAGDNMTREMVQARGELSFQLSGLDNPVPSFASTADGFEVFSPSLALLGSEPGSPTSADNDLPTHASSCLKISPPLQPQLSQQVGYQPMPSPIWVPIASNLSQHPSHSPLSPVFVPAPSPLSPSPCTLGASVGLAQAHAAGVQQAGKGLAPSKEVAGIEQKCRAADLEVEAASLKLAALQMQVAAQHVRRHWNGVGSGFPGAAVSAPASLPMNAAWAAATSPAGSLCSTPPCSLQPSGAKLSKNQATCCSPRVDSSESASQASIDEASRTTVMLRNLPAGYTRTALLELLDNQGFKGSYDFVYLPVDFVSMTAFGYCFINLVCPSEALRIWKHFDGFTAWPSHAGADADPHTAPLPCAVSWGDPLQGLSAHIERYRNSPVMHKDVPDYVKPMTFARGTTVKFPPPTKRIRPPRLKHILATPDADSTPSEELA